MADKFSSINEKSIFTLKTISIYMLNYGDVRIKLLIVRLRARPNHRLISIEMAIGAMIITGRNIIAFLLNFSALIVDSTSFNLIK